MKIIGIHNTGVTSSCALVENGKLSFAVAEERITRSKYDKYFPISSIKKCLKYSKLDFKDIDIFAVGWNPAKNIALRTRPGFSEWVSYPGYRFSSNPNNLLPNLNREIKEYEHTLQEFNFKKNKKLKIVYVNHHTAHLAHAFFLSGFNKSDLLSIDGYGEASSFVWGRGNAKKIVVDKEQEYPHSIGEFFSTITSFLGYTAYKDEWKVMGMSAYGKYKKYYSKIKKLIKLDKKNIFLNDLNYFNYFNFDSKYRFSNSLIELLGEPREKNDKIIQKHFDIASAAQKVLEELVLNLIIKLSKKSKNNNLCLSGGVMMNSVLNQKIHDLKLYKNIYIPYSPDDQGNSIGAALWASNMYDKKNKFSSKQLKIPYTGREFSNFEIERQLKIFKVKYNKVSNIAKIGARFISEGKIIGWFQGKEEFGQRALGNRSILADPRKSSMKDKINLAVKFRESFRPFAPAIIDEYKKDYFVNGEKINSNYMERTEKFIKKVANKVPSVVHKDLTGRLQTVKKKDNKIFYDLIDEFRKITTIPIILNTSFNLNNEPIVGEPKDALRTFFTSGLDVLIIGNFVIKK